MNRLLWEYFFYFQLNYFFKRNLHFYIDIHVLLQKLQISDLFPPGIKSLVCISAICHLLLHVCHHGPTLQAIGFSPGPGGGPKWLAGRRRFDRAGNLAQMTKHAGFSALSACALLLSSIFLALSHPSVRICLRSQLLSTAKLHNPLTAHREREIRCITCISECKCPPVPYLCWIYCSEPFRSMESCTARIIQVHFKRWWDS